MSVSETIIVQESSKRPQTSSGTLYVAIDAEFLKKHNINPKDGAGLPDRIVTRHHVGGDRDGIFEIDLKENFQGDE